MTMVGFCATADRNVAICTTLPINIRKKSSFPDLTQHVLYVSALLMAAASGSSSNRSMR